MVLGKIKIKDKENKDDLLEMRNLIVRFSIQYVNSVFKSKFKFKNELKRLKAIEEYIKNTYNITYDIKKIILYLIVNIRINNKGLVYIQDFKLKNIPANVFYQLITFGTLSVPKDSILNDAFIFGVKGMRLKKLYER